MMRMLGEVAIVIGNSLVLSLIAKATIVSVAALAAAHIARRSRASVRHLLLATGFIILLMLPVIALVVPARDVGVPVPQSFATPGVDTLAPLDTSVPASRPVTSDGGPPPISSTRTWPSRSALLLVVWVTGVAFFLVPIIVGLVRVSRLRRNGVPWRDGQVIVAEVSSRAAIRRPIQLLLHEAVAGPMTCGIVRPAIVLPRAARGWSREDLRCATVHEVEHIRRLDWLVLCIARTVCALYWFHPLVWIAWRRPRLEAERACDDAVLLLSTPPDTYADQLVTLAERLASSSPQSMLAMANRGDLSARVSAVLDAGQRRGRAGAVAVATAACSAVILLALVAPLRTVAVAQARADQSGAASGQPGPTATQRFEVASLRVNREVSDRPTLMRPILQPGGRVLMRNQTLRDLILTAYGVRENELVGGPDWIRSTGFDLEARGAADMSAETARAMLRTLLADRFSLAVHREQRELPMYVLTMAARDGEPGPQLRRAAAQCAAPTRPKGMPPGPPPSQVPLLPVPLGVVGTPPRCRSIFTGGHFSGRAVSMDVLAGELADAAGRPVVNRTGLNGEFDLDLSYTAELIAQPSPETATAPELTTALQEQLGLKLEAGRGPVDVLVIDRALIPTEN